MRAGTRASRLARWQTEHVIARLSQTWPALSFERVEVRTLGDRLSDVPLPRIGDRGLFTRELEDGLRSGTIDFAVHSLKDLPTEAPEGLALGAVLARDDPRDVLVSREGRRLADLPPGARLGTSSLRRRAQVMALRRDLEIADIRGNVPTRVEKVQRGESDATLLAMAGLRRLDMTSVVTEVLRGRHDGARPRPGRAGRPGARGRRPAAGGSSRPSTMPARGSPRRPSVASSARSREAARRRSARSRRGTPRDVCSSRESSPPSTGRTCCGRQTSGAVADEREALALGDLVAAALARQGAGASSREARQLAAAGDPA